MREEGRDGTAVRVGVECGMRTIEELELDGVFNNKSDEVVWTPPGGVRESATGASTSPEREVDAEGGSLEAVAVVLLEAGIGALVCGIGFSGFILTELELGIELGFEMDEAEAATVDDEVDEDVETEFLGEIDAAFTLLT